MTTIIYRADPPADDAALVAAQAAINAGIVSANNSVASAAAYAAAAAASASAALSGAFPAVGGVNLAISGELDAATINTTGTIAAAGVVSGAAITTPGTITATGSLTAGSLTSTGNATVAGTLASGAVTATSAALSGGLSAASGTFSAGVSATTGTFSAGVSGTTGTFSAAVTGTTGTFTAGAGNSVTAGANATANPTVSIVGTGQLGLRYKVGGLDRWHAIVANAESGGNTGSDYILQSFTDAGASTNLTTFTRSSGLLTHSGPALIHPNVNSNVANSAGLVAFLNQTGGRGGKIGATLQASNSGYVSTPAPAWVPGITHVIGDVVSVGFNLMTATSSGVSGSTTPACSKFVPTSSDGGVTWAFLGIPGGLTYGLVGAFTSANMTDSFGGTPTGPLGVVFGLNTQANISVPNGVGVVGFENNFGLAYPALGRIGEQIIAGISGTNQGLADDVGWRIDCQRDGAGGGAAPLRHLMAWGGRTSGKFVDPNGYGLRCYSSGWSEPGGVILTQGAGGIDLTEFQASGVGYFGGGFSFRARGAQVLDSGDIQTNAALIHGTASGVTVDAGQYHVTSAALHAGGGGSNWVTAGGFAYCTDGSIVRITAVSGGAVTGVSLVYGAYSSAAPGTVTASPEHLTGSQDTAGNVTLPSTIQVDLTSSLANSGAPVLTLGGVATVSFASIANLKTLTVASLPSAASAGVGAVAYVTDATAPTYRGALVGGGTVKCLVTSDGTSWTSS